MVIDLNITIHTPPGQEGTTEIIMDGPGNEQALVERERLSLRYAELFRLFLKHRDRISQVTFRNVPILQSLQESALPPRQPQDGKK
jgi:hypothetical protein